MSEETCTPLDTDLLGTGPCTRLLYDFKGGYRKQSARPKSLRSGKSSLVVLVNLEIFSLNISFFLPCLMIGGNMDSDHSKVFIKVCMICPVMWVPQSLEIIEGVPQGGKVSSNTISLPL